MIIQGTAIIGTTVSSSAATVAADSYFNLVSLLLPGNGTNGAQNNTFLDSSSNALTVTRSGNPTQGTFSPFSQTGWSNYFDGSGDSISAPDNAALEFGSGDFTIEAWIYLTAYSASYSGNYAATIVARDVSGGRSYIFSVGGTASSFTGLNFINFDGSGNANLIFSASATINLNTWYHVAVSRSSTTFRLFLDGTLIGTTTSAVSVLDTATPTRIGSGAYSGFEYYTTGYISNVRIVKGTAVYTAAFTPSTTPLTAISGTSLLTCQSNRFIDNSTNAFAITVAGNTAVQVFAPFDPTAAYSTTTVGGSAYLDGSGDYLTISNPASLLTFGTGDFTIECFVYPTAASSSSYVCWIYGTTNVINAIIINSNTGAVTFRLRGTNLSETDVTSSSGLLRVGEWTHLALVRTGTNFYGYVNGTRFSTTIASNAAFNEAQAQFFTQPQIGAKSNTVGDYFTGYVSGWRALKGTALYTAATITVPSAPLTAIANTSALLNSTNGGITDAAAKNVLETVGGAAISTTQSKFGGSSMYFDGSGDYLVTPAQAITSLTGDFTVEFWAYRPSAGNNFFYTTGDDALSSGIAIYIGNSGNNLRVYNANGVVIDVALSGISFPTSTWTHIALVRSSGVVKLFVAGSQAGSNWSSSTTFSGRVYLATEFNNGSAAGTGNCYLQDFRITNGYARYTANFTPPTTAFPTQ